MNPFAYSPAELAKAITAALLAGLTALGTAVTDGTISPQEWVGVAVAIVATFSATFWVQNANPKAKG